MNNHLTEDRLLELFEERGPQFSKEELEHLTDCQECGEARRANGKEDRPQCEQSCKANYRCDSFSRERRDEETCEEWCDNSARQETLAPIGAE